jgi:acetyl esterase/lipase
LQAHKGARESRVLGRAAYHASAPDLQKATPSRQMQLFAGYRPGPVLCSLRRLINGSMAEHCMGASGPRFSDAQCGVSPVEETLGRDHKGGKMRHMTFGAISVGLLLAWAGTSWPQPKRPEKQPLPQPTKKIVYKKVGDKELLLHVFEPPGHKAADHRPAIVFFHGGAWNIGDPNQFYTQCAYLAQRGMWAASVQYRLMPIPKKTDDPVPDAVRSAKSIGDCVADAKAAVRHVREHAKELGIDPERIAAGGGSAGGHLAAAAAVLPEIDPKDRKTLVGKKPNVQCLPEIDPKASTVSSKPNLLVLFNPPIGADFSNYLDLEYFTKETPPSIWFYGTKDKMVKSGPACVAQGKNVGFSVEVYMAEDQGHGFFNNQPWTDRTMYQVDRFLAKNGYVKGDPTIKLPDGTHLQEIK